MFAHAYDYWAGKIRGVDRNGFIVAATVLPPFPGQNDNYVNVEFADGECTMVRAMDTYEPYFIRMAECGSSKVHTRHSFRTEKFNRYTTCEGL